MALKIVYIDYETSRIIRVADYAPAICPADLDECRWMVIDDKNIPQVSSIHMIKFSYGSVFDVTHTEPTQTQLDNYQIISKRADALERLSRMINNQRFIKNKNMFTNVMLYPEYDKEIEIYNQSGTVGPLLSSLVDNDNEVETAIQLYNVHRQTYTDFLIQSEALFNKWSRKIKTSNDPISVLEKMIAAIGPFLR